MATSWQLLKQIKYILIYGLFLLGSCKGACMEVYEVQPLEKATGNLIELDKSDAKDAKDGKVGWWPNLAVDTRGQVHLFYCDVHYGDLKYALRNDAGSWTITTVMEKGAVGKYISMALDEKQFPHVVFYDQTNQNLLYGYFYQGKTWYFEKIAWGLEIGSGNKLLIDNKQIVHVFYYSTKGKLLHSHRESPFSQADSNVDTFKRSLIPNTNPWKTEVVGDIGGSFSIKLDAKTNVDNDIYLSFVDWDLINTRFYLGYYNGDSWHMEMVDEDNAPGWRSAITFKDNQLQLIYNASRSEDLLIAMKNEVGLWEKAKFPFNANNIAVAQDEKGQLFIAHEFTHLGGLAHGSVRYLEQQGTTWRLVDVDNKRATGSYLDMALLPNGRPIIAYYDDIAGSLKVYSEDHYGK